MTTMIKTTTNTTAALARGLRSRARAEKLVAAAEAALQSGRTILESLEAKGAELDRAEAEGAERNAERIADQLAAGHGVSLPNSGGLYWTERADQEAAVRAQRRAVELLEGRLAEAREQLVVAQKRVNEVKASAHAWHMTEIVKRIDAHYRAIERLRTLAGVTLFAREMHGVSEAFSDALSPRQLEQLNTRPPLIAVADLFPLTPRKVVDLHTPISEARVLDTLAEALSYWRERDAALESAPEASDAEAA
jgi:hypothetical protein